MDTDIKLRRLIPSPDFFEIGTPAEHVKKAPVIAGQLTTTIYKIETPPEGGILAWNTGDKYPQKGLIFQEAVFACDEIKRVLMNTVKLLGSKPMLPVTGMAALTFAVLPRSAQQRIIDKVLIEFGEFCEVNWDHWGRSLQYANPDGSTFGIKGLTLKPTLYCDVSREIWRVGVQMIGNTDEVHRKCYAGEDMTYEDIVLLAKRRLISTICMILQYDDGYRYPIQDGFGEINLREVIKNPGKDIARVLSIIASRGSGTSHKFQAVAKLIPWIFKLKIFRDAAREFFQKIDVEKVKLDEADWYRCMLWGGYRFKGVSDEERVSIRLMIDAEWTYREQHA